MKKFLVAAAAIAVAIIGFGALGVSTSEAAPTNVYAINGNVAAALTAGAGITDCDATTAGVQAPPCNLNDPLQLAGFMSGVSLADAAAASAAQVGTAADTGLVYIVVQTDGSGTDVMVNPKGLLTNPVVSAGDGLLHCADASAGTGDTDCDGDATTDDGFVVFDVTGPGTNARGTSLSLTAAQDSVSLPLAVTTVGTPHDLNAPVTAKATIQEAAASCALTDSTSAPTRTGILSTVTDIDGTSLVGVPVTWASSDNTVVDLALVGAGITLKIDDTVGVGAGNVACGDNPGTANANISVPGANLGTTGTVTKSLALTVTGVPATVALTASPAAIACDGTSTSTVTAKVTDSAGNNVVDNTPVTFSVVALGTANPIVTSTTDGNATSVVTPLSGSTSGVVVTVTSGAAASSIRIDCTPSLAVPTVGTGGGAAATATPVTGVRPPNTGTGGFANQDGSAGFPMWVLVALALGSIALVGGGVVTRRAGK